MELAYPRDSKSYTDGSLATGRVSLVGQVSGEGSDEEVLQKRISTVQTAEKKSFNAAIYGGRSSSGVAEVIAAGLGDGNPKQKTWSSRLGEPCIGPITHARVK